jgi:hypothetical protein
VAGGLELALWADLRIAGASAIFTANHRSWQGARSDLDRPLNRRSRGARHGIDQPVRP